MADTQVTDSKSTEDSKVPKEVTIRLCNLDCDLDVKATLEENVDTAHPPYLRRVDTTPIHSPKQAPQPRETHVILSTGSGHQKAVEFYEQAVSSLISRTYPDSASSPITLHTTQSETSILELARDVFFPAANAGRLLRLILLSGDGGIVDLVNSLASPPRSASYLCPQVVLLPLGTANALFHSINASAENPWGLAALASSTSKPLPTLTATFSPGSRLLVDEARSSIPLPGGNVLHSAVVVSWGMHASLVADSDSAAYRKFGIERFKMAAKEALYPADGALPHAYSGRVKVLDTDGRWSDVGEGKHLYTLATLVSNLEKPFTISPASRPLDGSLHIVHFGPTTGDEAMRIMGLAYQGGKHVEDESVTYEKVEGVRIEMGEAEERWRRVCVDGKIVVVEEGGWVEVRKGEGEVIEVVIVEDEDESS
ncbi:ATP-NAD kinase-like domain-containing protein [Phaeosphaeria sp. MPI-PUGE-AT-0046c]|nr:ATP-NAD kinase-like domain-containing protein [Phaeosphaeria sp. MPI-PUGE-AT-0046c]